MKPNEPTLVLKGADERHKQSPRAEGSASHTFPRVLAFPGVAYVDDGAWVIDVRGAWGALASSSPAHQRWWLRGSEDADGVACGCEDGGDS